MLHLGSAVMREMITGTSVLSTEPQSGAMTRKEKRHTEELQQQLDVKPHVQLYWGHVFLE